jgi:hypothetical protein
VNLTPAHKELIKLLAAEAVEQFLEDQHNLLEEKPMETGERPDARHRSSSD